MPNPKTEAFAVPPLRSGGLMLGYSCNQACRHCSYRSRPAAGEWMDDATLERVMDALANERMLVDIHIGGGEPTLNPELAVKAVRMAVAKKVRLSYLETNGHYAETKERAVEVLAPFRDAGLPAILLSVSPYHNEFIPLRHTLNCLEAGMEVFGEDGVFPWLSHFLPMLGRLDPDTTHTLKEFLDANGLEWGSPALLRLFPLTPGGRAPKGLRDFFALRPAEDFRGGHCMEILGGVSHFHVDPNGYLFTGHCPGIIAGRAPAFHEAKDQGKDPVFSTLALGGPHALMETARNECGFVPDPVGYVSPCDLCFQVRRALFIHDADTWSELGPATFYCP